MALNSQLSYTAPKTRIANAFGTKDAGIFISSLNGTDYSANWTIFQHRKIVNGFREFRKIIIAISDVYS